MEYGIRQEGHVGYGKRYTEGRTPYRRQGNGTGNGKADGQSGTAQVCGDDDGGGAALPGKGRSAHRFDFGFYGERRRSGVVS